MSDRDLDQWIDREWMLANAPGIVAVKGQLPEIPLPKIDRCVGKWSLILDRRHLEMHVLLYCDLGGLRAYRMLATVKTRRELIGVYEAMAKEKWPIK